MPKTGKLARFVAMTGVAAAIWGVALPAFSGTASVAGASINRHTVNVAGASINRHTANPVGASTN